MTRHRFFAGFLVFLLAFAMTADAWARAGRGSSFGSRGSRTYDRPIERSITPPSATQPGAGQPMYNPNAMRPAAPLAAAPMATQSGGFFQRNPFMGGIMGGLVGAGIGSMLFGHSPAMAAAADASPTGSLFGTLIQFALIGGLIWMAMRFFRSRKQAAAGGADMGYTARSAAATAPMGGGGMQKEFDVGPEDQAEFGRIIEAVQKAWSEGNPVAMRNFVTPEVSGWIGEDLARDQSNGVRNVVEDVKLLSGDVSETWREKGLDFATAIITFSSRDYLVSLSDNSVVGGDPDHPVEATEAWTFVRSNNGTWLLSAIEQL